MIVLLLVVGTVLFVIAVTVMVLHYAKEPELPSPRPDRDDRVAVLEGGSGRGWD